MGSQKWFGCMFHRYVFVLLSFIFALINAQASLAALDLTINHAVDNNVNGATPFSPTGWEATISGATINTALASGNVTVTTVGTPTAGNGDITIGAAGILTNGNSLNIIAARDINQNFSLTRATGSVTYTAANNINLGANLTANDLTLTAANNINLIAGDLRASNINIGGGNLNGTGVINGNVTVSGLGSVTAGNVGSLGLLTFNNALSFSGGTLNINIGGTTRGSGYSAINLGSANLGGKLKVRLTGTLTPVLGQRFSIIQTSGSGKITGGFSSFELDALPAGLGWSHAIENNANGTQSYVLEIKVAQTLTFNTIPSRLLVTSPFSIAATASSGLAVSFTSATPAVCSVSGNAVTLLVAGTCTIRANQAGNATYAPAPQVTQSFRVNSPIDGGGYHSLRIGSDGKLYAWGANDLGQLGDGTTTQRITPVPVNLPSGVSPLALSAGVYHSLVIGNDGKLYAWGRNYYGEVGDGTTTQRNAPVPVNLPSGVSAVSVAGGFAHSLAIGSDGKLYAWGSNNYGELGDGTNTNRSNPVLVNLPSGVSPVAVTAGDLHSLALGSDGKIYAWGYNPHGQVGDGSTTNRNTPVQVTLPSGVSAVSVTAGPYHSLAIGSDGKLYVWGRNNEGQLGDDTTTQRNSPVLVNLPSGVSPLMLAASYDHSLALGSNGKLYTWGYNNRGQLGDGTNINRTTPVQINIPSGVNLVAVAAGSTHSLALGSDGKIYAWGGNDYGQLGDGTTTNRNTPVLGGLQPQTITFASITNRVLGAAPFTITANASSGLAVSFTSATPAVCSVSGNTVTLLVAGTCTIRANQAGNAFYAAAPQVTQSFRINNPIAAKGNHSLRIGSDGKLYAWGYNGQGQLGDGTTTQRTNPVQVNLPSGVSHVAVTAGDFHSLAIGSDGKLYAWGRNIEGQLGDGTTTNRTTPVQVNLPSGVSPAAVTAGQFHSLAIGSDGKLYAWGYNGQGQLGDGTTTYQRTTPVQVNLPSGVSPVAVTAGQYHSLAIGSDGKLYAWGDNFNGQLGDGTTTRRTTPVQVNLPSGVSAVAVTAGESHSLAIGSDGKLYAWGWNDFGQLGDGTNNQRTLPVQVTLPSGVSHVAVTAGDFHSLAIGSDGKLYAWGRNIEGQLGDGTTTNRTTPVQVNLPSGVSPAAVTAGQFHSLAIGSDGKLYAWGYNDFGQLGDGTTVSKLNPVIGGVIVQSQSISFAPLTPKPMLSAPFTVSATANSGLAVSFTSATPAICSVSGNTVTLVATGTCAITASQAGNATYAPALQVTQSFTVSLASQSINFAPLSNKILGDAPFTLSATASSGLTVTFSSISPSVCSVTGNTVTLLAAGTCTIEANQSGNVNYSSASPVQQSFTVSVQNGGGGADADGDVPLPEWLLVLMSASLLGMALRKRRYQ